MSKIWGRKRYSGKMEKMVRDTYLELGVKLGRLGG